MIHHFQVRVGSAWTSFTNWQANALTRWRSPWRITTGGSTWQSTTDSWWSINPVELTYRSKMMKSKYLEETWPLHVFSYPCMSVSRKMSILCWVCNNFVKTFTCNIQSQKDSSYYDTGRPRGRLCRGSWIFQRSSLNPRRLPDRRPRRPHHQWDEVQH